MNIGENIIQLRNENSLSETELTNNVTASREAISKYERGVAVPSVDVAVSIVDAFEVTNDFLIGKNHLLAVDKKTLKRMQDIDFLAEGTNDKLFFLINNAIQHTNAKKAFNV
jgi:predicted transcriptional regulator